MNQSPCTAGCSSHCAGCHSRDNSLYLTAEELSILHRLEELPFLPVGFRGNGHHPICLDCPGDPKAISDALTALRQKRLISLDPDIPLQGFDYAAYGALSRHGSMALTALGQEVLDLLCMQGVADR